VTDRASSKPLVKYLIKELDFLEALNQDGHVE